MQAEIDRIDSKSIQERNPSTVGKKTFRLNDRSGGGPLRALSEEDWKFWERNGYVVIKQAVEREKIDNLERLVWEFEELDPNDQATWYPPEKSKLRKTELSFNAGMIELYNHQYLWDTRQTQRVYDAFADVWGTEKLWVSIDRMNFNLPPEPGFEFKSFMHWDYDPDTDPQNVQGVLAISDQTDPEVGGFVCIPEIFRNYDAWRRDQPADWDWYRPDVTGLPLVPVLLEKGDLLIFNSKLCHGIRQNKSKNKVRIAQYISMMPARETDEKLREWRIRSWKERLAPQGYSLHGDPRYWERDKYPTARLTPLGERLLGLRDWQDGQERLCFRGEFTLQGTQEGREMSQELRRKVGQLFMVGFDALEANDHVIRMIREQKVGGVVLFRRNVHTPEQVSKLCRQLQEINAEVSDEPLLISLDQEGGMVMRIEEGMTPMPSAMAFQATDSVEDCEKLNVINGDEIRQIGVNMFLAPVLDVNNNRFNPVIGVRAYGEDPDTVIEYGLAAMRGIRSAGMIATAKHFPGHGDTSTDTHYDLASVPHGMERLNAVELAPFKAAIAEGVDAIMTAHVMFPAIEPDETLPATLSKAVLTDLLRKEMGFKGVVISDCLEMAAISEGIGVAKGAVASLQAGADIILISHRPERQLAGIEAVVEAVERGDIPMSRINEAVERVRKLKQVSAVREWKARPVKPKGLMKPEALALSKKVQKAALRVQGDFCPLDRNQPVALITTEIRKRSEIDEVALTRNKEARGSMLPDLLHAGMTVYEYALSIEVTDEELAEALAFVKGAPQIVVQTYNAVLEEGQRRLLAALPQDRLWVVAGRLPYDLDLAPKARGRLASYGSRPSALLPVAEKLAGL